MKKIGNFPFIEKVSKFPRNKLNNRSSGSFGIESKIIELSVITVSIRSNATNEIIQCNPHINHFKRLS